MPRRLIATFVLCVTGDLVLAQQPAPKPTPRDPQRELAMSVPDGFTVAAVGDCIIARPVSHVRVRARGKAHSRCRRRVR